MTMSMFNEITTVRCRLIEIGAMARFEEEDGRRFYLHCSRANARRIAPFLFQLMEVRGELKNHQPSEVVPYRIVGGTMESFELVEPDENPMQTLAAWFHYNRPTEECQHVDLNAPGHFCGARNCCYFRHTHVGKFCVSSVGCYHPREGVGPMEEIGSGRTFETYVFNNGGTLHECQHNGIEVAAICCNSREAAEIGHATMVLKILETGAP